MSEYQYYEFQTVGTQLGDDAMREMSALSARAQISRTSASFTYAYGDFRGDPIKVLMRHFDAMLYLANWGSRQLAFRFPISSVDHDALRRFAFSKTIRVTKSEAHVLVDMFLDDETDSGWLEGDGALNRVIGLYEDLLAGDYRALFVLWLQAASMVEETELRLPPIPAGLRELSETHRTLISFFGIDPDLVAAAEPFSAPIEPVTNEGLARALDSMPGGEQSGFLRKMVMGESPAVVFAELRRRLRADALSGQAAPAAPQPAPASAGVLFAKARDTQADRANKAKQQARGLRLP
jgi:hypothetical protein